jgi:hypothetical protein
MATKAKTNGAATTKKGAKQEEVTANIVASMSMKEFAKEYGIIKVSPVRINVNGYPFVTFLQETKGDDGKNLAENVYFSKAAAEKVEEGDEASVIKELGLKVLELEYSNGETRLKLSMEGDGGEYSSIEDLF